jgi:hypothetical protein
MIDDGFTASQLWVGAWLLGAVSVTAWAFLARRLDGPGSWDSPAVFALALAVTCSVFSACCAVLVAIKSAEVRIRRGRSATDVTQAP